MADDVRDIVLGVIAAGLSAAIGRPGRKHGNHTFVPLLKVVNSQVYGPDVVEPVADAIPGRPGTAPGGGRHPHPAPRRPGAQGLPSPPCPRAPHPTIVTCT
ncbi:hypothetical protein [Streptomyces cinereospinus]|uniref:Uncharacterized protein n=1 Tax=Streptomyces cinereospinus TaxID=285561 RepID=A0ABV5N5N2_9ACTN